MEKTSSRSPGQGRDVAVPVLGALLLMAAVGLCYREWRQYSLDNERAAQKRAIVDTVNLLISALLGAETGQRGYLLTGEERYLQPYNQAVQAIPGELANLGKLVRGRPKESGSVAQLNGLVDQKLTELRDTIELRRTAGMPAALAVVLTDRGRQSMDQIRATCSEIQDLENAAPTQNSLAGEAAAAAALLITVAGSLLLLFRLSLGLEPLASPDPQAQRRSWPLRYGAAILVVVVTVLFRAALTPIMGGRSMPFTLFFPAVWFAAWFGGLWPGALSILLSGLAGSYFFAEPVGSLLVRYHDDQVALLMLVTVGFGMALLSRAQEQTVLRATQAEKAERQERQRFETTLASIGDAVITTDAAGKITSLNSVAQSVTGWAPEEAMGKPLPQIFVIRNEETGREVENPATTALREGRTVGLAHHTVLLQKNGTPIPIDDSAAPIRQPGGAVLGVVLVFRDVTVRRKSQEAAARLAAIVEHSGDAMITKDLNGIVRTWNRSAERMFGYCADEIIGKHVTVLFPRERLSEEDYIIGRLRAGEPVERFETVRVAKNGRPIPVAVSMSPLKDADGQIVGASKVIHDITDLVAAREALTREKELLATTLASIGDAVIVTDPQGKIAFLNAEAERLTEWKNCDASGRSLPEIFRIINENTRVPVEGPVEKVMRLGGVVGLANHTVLIAKNGTEIPIDDSAAPIRRSDGPLLGVVLVFRDFTQRKQAEKALREAHEQLADRAGQLEELVQERTAKLQDMVNELQHMSYAMAHDMRAPLRAMNTFASLLAEGASGGISPAEAQEYTRRITVAAKRLDKLIQDALHYTTLAHQEIPREPVDLSKLVRDLIDTYPNFHSDKAEIVVANDLPVVIGNDSLLTQCFSNLLGNAVKFVAPGVRPEVRVWAEVRDSTARIWIRDNGIGISTNSQRRLFQMFQKLETGYEGTGIGLAIVRKVVERMGGRVGVDSQPGSGSSFWVELRLSDCAIKGKTANS
jgi:PAS domain S-box-containing protein